MALTATQRKSLEGKAKAEGSKSAGMRLLLDNGYTVPEVQDVFDAAYGFVYGVAVRNGNVTPEPRGPREPKAAATTKSAKAPARPVGRPKGSTAASKVPLGKNGKPLTGAAAAAALRKAGASAKPAPRTASAKGKTTAKARS